MQTLGSVTYCPFLCPWPGQPDLPEQGESAGRVQGRRLPRLLSSRHILALHGAPVSPPVNLRVGFYAESHSLHTNTHTLVYERMCTHMHRQAYTYACRYRLNCIFPKSYVGVLTPRICE